MVAFAGTGFGVVPRCSIKYVCVLLLLLLLRGFQIPLLRRRRRRHLTSLDRCVSNSLSNQASSSHSRSTVSISLRLFNVSYRIYLYDISVIIYMTIRHTRQYHPAVMMKLSMTMMTDDDGR